MRLLSSIVFIFIAIFTLQAGSAFAQPRAYIPSLFEDTVTVLDVSTNTVIDVIDVGDRAFSAAVTPDGTKVYVAVNPSSGPGTVEVIQTSTNSVIATINVGGSPSDVAITPDGTRAYVSNFNGNVNVINTATDTQILPNISIPGANPNANFISISPNGLFAYVLTTATSQRLVTINTTTNMVIPGFTRTVGEGIGMDITPDGTTLYIAIINAAIGGVDQVLPVSLNTTTGEPTLGTPFGLVFSGGSPPVDCELRPESIAVHPTTSVLWVLTDPRPFMSGLSCPQSSPFHSDLVLIDPSAMNPVLLIAGLPTPPWPFVEIAFTRDGSDAVLIEGSRIRTTPTSFPLMLSSQTTIDASFPESPYYIGPPMSTLTVTKSGMGDGNITSMNPEGMNCDSSMNEICDIAVPDGLMVTLTATPDASSEFSNWGAGPCNGTNPSVTINVSADTTCTAVFVVRQFDVDVTINPAGGGSVMSSPSGIDCPGTCTAAFDINTFINLNETADPDFDFVNWTGDPDCGDGDIDDLMADTSCTANFAIKRFNVAVTKDGNGPGTVTSMPAGINCGADCDEDYDIHTTVTLTPTPGATSLFAGWSGPADCDDGIIQDLISDITCNATFNLQTRELTVTTFGNGDGTVTAPAGTGDGISCGEGNMNCNEPYFINTMVTLTATPDADSDFTAWTGDCSSAGTNPMATVTMSAAMTCNAEFTLKQFDVDVVIDPMGNGTGTVTYAPGGAVCPGDCSERFNIHTEVTLTPTPDAISLFAGWSGPTDCDDGIIQDLTQDIECTARFNLQTRELTLNKNGNGDGNITSNPAGIACDVGCDTDTGDFFINSAVTLTATPDPDSIFTGWDGACAPFGTNNTATVTMSDAMTCEANFTLKQFSVNVAFAGPGNGTVTYAPSGAVCAPDCSQVFNIHTQVVLTPAPASGSFFFLWDGPADCADGIIQDLTSDITCTAVFNSAPPNPPQQANLSVIKSASSSSVEVGQEITYTIEVNNDGPDTAPQVIVSDRLSSSASFVSASSECFNNSGTIFCDLGDMINGSSTSVQIVISATQPGALINTAIVRSSVNDPQTNNNSSSVVVEVAGDPTGEETEFLTVEAETMEITAEPGGSISIPVNINNPQTPQTSLFLETKQTVTGATFTVDIPEGFTLEELLSTKGVCSIDLAECEIGDIVPGETVIVVMDAAASEMEGVFNVNFSVTTSNNEMFSGMALVVVEGQTVSVEDGGDSGGGCAIAGPNTDSSSVFGLLLYALIPAVILGRRRIRK